MATSNSDPSLARGGGNATAAGVAFQAAVATYFSGALLREKALDRPSDLGRAVPQSIRCETEAPIDNILIETAEGGFIFIQAKSTIQFSVSLDSPLGKTAEQFVRQWILCAAGTGKRRWDRPLTARIDRFVLAVGPNSSATVTHDLASALRAARAQASAPLPKSQKGAWDRFWNLIGTAWQAVSGKRPSEGELRAMASLVDILVFDFAGPDRALVTEAMRDIVQTENDAALSFAALQECFVRLMASRLGVDALGLRNLIAGSLRLKEPPSYRADVAQLRQYSDQTRGHLKHFEETTVGAINIKIERKCTQSAHESPHF
jgi:hypothetical protein